MAKEKVRKLKSDPTEKDFEKKSGKFGDILSHYDIELKPRSEKQKVAIKAIKQNIITFLVGSAGSGKTFLPLAIALQGVKAGKYKTIKLIRSTVISEQIGYLPGGSDEKMLQYVSTMIEPLYKLVGKDTIDALKEKGVIEFLPVGFITGHNFEDCVAVVDEFTNLSLEQLYSVITRVANENTKIILCGDYRQCYMKDKKKSCYNSLDRISRIENIGFVEFGREDIVRPKIVQDICEAFEELL